MCHSSLRAGGATSWGLDGAVDQGTDGLGGLRYGRRLENGATMKGSLAGYPTFDQPFDEMWFKGREDYPGSVRGNICSLDWRRIVGLGCI